MQVGGLTLGFAAHLVIMHGSLGPCRNQPSINYADVDSDEQHNKQIVQKSKKSEHGLGEDVEWRNEVEQGEEAAEEHSETKHPDETSK